MATEAQLNVQNKRSALAGAAETSPSSRWAPSRSQLRVRLYICLVALDCLCVFGSFVLAALIWEPATDRQLLLMGSLLLPVYLGFALSARAYSAEVIQEPWRGIGRAVRALSLAAAAVILIAFSLKTSTEFSRMGFGLGFVFCVVLLAVSRDIFLRKARSILGGNPFSVILITDGDHPVPAGAFSEIVPADSLFDPDQHCPTMYDRLALALKDADRVIVACTPERRMSWVKALKGANIQSEIIAPELTALAPLGLGRMGTSPTIIVAEGPLSTADSFLKRAFDIVVAMTGIVVMAPVLLLTALLIRLESPGPVLFVQTRIGRGNRLFRMCKFRSMRVEQSDGHGHASTARDDDRVTVIGRFIRKTSIDELPQLFNVLFGDMSIVGPRPHALGSRAEDKLFWEIDERYWHRHAAKPGLTGLAQIRGYRGATERESDLIDRLQSDLEYLNAWSIWKDVKIIVMTFRVLIHRNAF